MDNIPPLRPWRLKNGLTQRTAAGLIPVTRTTWARWETGTRKIDDKLLPQVEEKTGIPARYLRPDLAVLIEAAQ